MGFKLLVFKDSYCDFRNKETVFRRDLPYLHHSFGNFPRIILFQEK